ncbi:MAG: hypothetical protein ACTIJ2_06475, partial [Sphingobacteriaceae bacterium]
NKGPLDNENISKKDRVESRSLRENIEKCVSVLETHFFVLENKVPPNSGSVSKPVEGKKN